MQDHPKKSFSPLKSAFLALFLTLISGVFYQANAQDEPVDVTYEGPKSEEGFSLSEVIIGHVLDDHSWHFF